MAERQAAHDNHNLVGGRVWCWYIYSISYVESSLLTWTSPIAIVVGCLPSFIIFIRGKIGASRTQFFDTSPVELSKANSNITLSGPIAQARAESFIFEEDVEMATNFSDGRSDKALDDRPSAVKQGWSQRWHRGIAGDTEREGARNSGFGD